MRPANWSFTSKKDRARLLARVVPWKGMRTYKSRVLRFSARVYFTQSHVSTNIPRKLGGMKSFAPFWLSCRHDERFVEPTRKIFSSYRGWEGRRGSDAGDEKYRTSFRYTNCRASKNNSLPIYKLFWRRIYISPEWKMIAWHLSIRTYILFLWKSNICIYWWLLLRFHFFKIF